MVSKKKDKIGVVILGSTGSIGQSTLSVVERHSDLFRIVALSANRSIDLLAAQAHKHSVTKIVVTDASAIKDKEELSSLEWKTGVDGIAEVVADPEVDIVVNAIVGAAGLQATLSTIEAGKKLALANKESLVVGGPLVLESLRKCGGEIIPIDSEHSAIYQCIKKEELRTLSRLILTASGGPFFNLPAEQLESVTLQQALKHPTWEMGQKVTIDSATLANKALYIIEAHFLFGVEYESISAVIHPQSIVHSFVEFIDGSVLAQLGSPTMELPILYALAHPKRVADSALRTFEPASLPSLEFESIDEDRFPMFWAGVQAGRQGGTAPAIFNASNEIAVEAFLKRQIKFSEIPMVVDKTSMSLGVDEVDSLKDIVVADESAREVSGEVVQSIRS